MRTEACLCGGTITARSVETTAEAVYAHRQTDQHRQWASRRATVRTNILQPVMERVACMGDGTRGCLP